MRSSRPSARQRLRGSKGWEALTLAKALAVGGERREAAVARLVRPANLFQLYTTTGWDRYPEEFSIVRAALRVEQPRILSFGCSSGDELLTLHEYFPTARIHGIDANPLAVRTARKRISAASASNLVTVSRRSDAGSEPLASYDLVLALAVFRHGALADSPPRCDQLIRFADFERTVAALAAAVKPGGYFVIRHSNFRFSDCAAASGFELVRGGFGSAGASGLPTPVYSVEDRLLDLDQRDDGIYLKRR
jgi:SAM-dependent methyltransferase